MSSGEYVHFDSTSAWEDNRYADLIKIFAVNKHDGVVLIFTFDENNWKNAAFWRKGKFTKHSQLQAGKCSL